MRCLQVSKYYPPVHGGIENVAYDIASGLKKRGWRIEVLCSNTIAKTVFELGEIPVIRTASFGKIASTSVSPIFLIWFWRLQKRQDIIHVHMPNPLANFAIWITRPSCKLVIHWHSDIVKQKFLLRVYEPFQKWLLKRSDAIITTSMLYANSSEALRPYMQKLHVICNGILDPTITSDEIQRKEIAHSIRTTWPGKKLIFALGRMTYYKGFHILVNAARYLPEDVIVIIGGDGELFDSLSDQVKRSGLENRVILLGQVDEDKLPSYFEATDLFCLPSLARSEAFGLVMIEAMAFGKPIVATEIDGSGVPWVNLSGISGINAKPNSSSDLAKCLLEVLNNDTLKLQLGKGARNRFETYFRHDKMIDAIEFLYASLGLHK